MNIITPKAIDIDGLVVDVFLKSLEIAGGPRKLIEQRNLTWVPSLFSAAYAVVLANELNLPQKEIAEFLSLTPQTISSMLRAKPALIERRISFILGEEKQDIEQRTHAAGGLAKLAYQQIKSGGKTVHFLTGAYEEAAQLLGVIWPLNVLKSIKGETFPIGRKRIYEILGNIEIRGVKITDFIEKLPEQIKSPSALLKYIKIASE